MFLGLSPQVAVITNIEHDHPDMFPALADVLEAFREFAALLPPDGTLVVCADDSAANVLADVRFVQRYPSVAPAVTYGILFFFENWQALLTYSFSPPLSRSI